MNTIEAWRVDAFLDGQSDRAVAKASRQNPAMLQPFVEQHAFEAALGSELFRHTCPDPDDLMNFAWGMLSGQAVALVSTHLLDCSHCQQEASQLMPTAAAEPTRSSSSLLERLHVELGLIIGRILPAPALGLATVRSAESDEAQLDVCTIDEMQWDITFTHQPHEGLTYQLNGIVFGPAPPEFTQLEICIVRDDTIIDSSLVTANGTFELDAVPQGRYTLCLFGNDTTICIPDVVVGTF